MKKEFDYLAKIKKCGIPDYHHQTITPNVRGRIVLKQIIVSSDIFQKIIDYYGLRVVEVEDLKPLYRGYEEKNTIALKDDYLICTENAIDTVFPLIDFTWWKQVIVRNDPSLPPETIKSDISGGYAYNYMRRLLKRYYSVEEIENILQSFNNIEYDGHLKQYHLQNLDEGLNTYENCFKFDINSAHAYALSLMFPQAKDAINRMYLKRSEKPINKAILNYFAGYLAHRGYRGAYNWIVQQTTIKLLSAINECGGTLLYANTDGFLVMNPKKIIHTSKKLGEFKLEYRGNVHTYVDRNYWYIQQADNCREKDRGTLPCILRQRVDLSIGKVVHYKRVKGAHNLYEYIDIKEEFING